MPIRSKVTLGAIFFTQNEWKSISDKEKKEKYKIRTEEVKSSGPKGDGVVTYIKAYEK